MNKKTVTLFRILAVILVLAIAGAMMVIGRGHTVYFDNKTIEYEGQSYSPAYKVTCYKDGEKFAKLSKRDRGMVDVMGQKIKVTLEIVEKKGDEPVVKTLTFPLPYSMDGVIINIPAFLSKLPMDVFMTEFIPAVVEETESTEPADEFGLSGLEG